MQWLQRQHYSHDDVDYQVLLDAESLLLMAPVLVLVHLPQTYKGIKAYQ